MKSILRLTPFGAALLIAAAAILCSPIRAIAQSGEVYYGNSSVAPVYNEATGSIVYILQPLNAPFPVNVNTNAISPVYVVVYPVGSTIPTASLQCLPTNCDHLNVLPFPDPDYGVLPGTDAACQAFNGGAPCSAVRGHVHLFPVASSGGDFNQAHAVKLVLFTGKAFTDGAINSKVTTLAQMQTLLDNGEAFVADTPITFHGSIVSGHTYDLGAPYVVPYP
jgi:hypothetical protein